MSWFSSWFSNVHLLRPLFRLSLHQSPLHTLAWQKRASHATLRSPTGMPWLPVIAQLVNPWNIGIWIRNNARLSSPPEEKKSLRGTFPIFIPLHDSRRFLAFSPGRGSTCKSSDEIQRDSWRATWRGLSTCRWSRWICRSGGRRSSYWDVSSSSLFLCFASRYGHLFVRFLMSHVIQGFNVIACE